MNCWGQGRGTSGGLATTAPRPGDMTHPRAHGTQLLTAKRGNTTLDTDHELHHTKPPYVMQGTSNPVLRKWKH
ncbi:Uncharacterised protein [Mycobacteroides abscessus subsp. abscessus]|nr:Uncharacterised protein [Mycobacteroides abscessus subsp. abscessus]